MPIRKGASPRGSIQARIRAMSLTSEAPRSSTPSALRLPVRRVPYSALLFGLSWGPLCERWGLLLRPVLDLHFPHQWQKARVWPPAPYAPLSRPAFERIEEAGTRRPLDPFPFCPVSRRINHPHTRLPKVRRKNGGTPRFSYRGHRDPKHEVSHPQVGF